MLEIITLKMLGIFAIGEHMSDTCSLKESDRVLTFAFSFVSSKNCTHAVA
jgi:hypothetical protein